MLFDTHNVIRAAQNLQVLSTDNDDGIFLMRFSSLGWGFECKPLGGADDTIQSRLNNFLNNDWPPGFIIQVCLFSSDNILSKTNDFKYERNESDDPFFKELINKRVDYLLEHTTKPIDPSQNLKVRDIRCVITCRMKHKGDLPTEEDIIRARELRIISQKEIGAVGLQPKPIFADDYVALMDDVLNHGEDSFWRENNPRFASPDRTLNEQVFDQDKSYDVDKDCLKIGDQYIYTLGIRHFPEMTYPGFGCNYLSDIMSGSRGLKSHFIINCSVHYPEANTKKSKLDSKRQFTVAQNTGPIRKFVPVLGLKNHGFEVLNQALDDGDRPVEVYFSISVMDQTKNKALEAAANAKSYFSELRFQLFIDKFYVNQFFLNSIPFGAHTEAIKDLMRYKTVATRHAAVLLPLFGPWSGTPTPVMNFVSRDGQLMNMSLFDSGTNYNAVCAASSGAGKSFFTQFIITNYLSIGGKCWVIDVGRSYLNLCETYGGDFVSFDDDSKICLNPFQLVKDFDGESDMLCGLVSAMAAPTQKLTDQQNSNLKRVLKELWDEMGTSMLIDHIEERLLQSEDRRLRDIGEQLFSFTSKGDYGKFFNGDNNVSFNNRFTVLELDDLQGRDHLMQVVLLQLIFQIQQDMYLGDRDRPKLTIIDEAWSLLTQGDVSKFIEHGYRRFRKYGGAALTVTQSILDLYQNETGRAIVENSANMYLLKQKGEAINNIKETGRLPLSDGGYQMLKTVTTVPRTFSEIYFITEYGQGIGRLYVDPFQALLYSTTAKDVNDIKNIREQNDCSLAEAINILLKQRGTISNG